MSRTAAVPALVLALLSWAQPSALAQGGRVSPHERVNFAFDNGKKITIDYGRPKREDPRSGQVRKVYGGLVPYDQPWRTGADEATTLMTDSDLMIGGTSVPAGTYTLYTIPRASGDWTLIISNATGQWGIPYPGEGKDFARINKLTTSPLSSPVDQLTIALDKTGPKAATLKISWENIAASIPVQQK
jgi:Protein of unknown function (DUF2911)